MKPEFRVTLFNYGNFRLDGGCIFGPVPRTIWSELYPADGENYISLATNSLLIEDEDHRKIVIDTGLGNKLSAKLKARFNWQPEASLPFKPEEITDVILTHLHADHVGGLLCSELSSKQKDLPLTSPTFLNAQIWLHQDNLATAKDPNVQEKQSYLSENWDFYKDSDFKLVSKSDYNFSKNISLHACYGHTTGMMAVELRFGKKGQSKAVFFASDLIPTASHIGLPYRTAYDIYAEQTYREKALFLAEACRNQALVIFQHDAFIPSGLITEVGPDRFSVTPLSLNQYLN